MNPLLPRLSRLLIFLLPGLLALPARSQQPVLRLPAATRTNTKDPQAAFRQPEDGWLKAMQRQAGFTARERSLNARLRAASGRLDDGTVYGLPLVFHIVSPNPATITDAQVAAAVAGLNAMFRKQGIYAGGKGTDTKIQFCLAKKAPDGNVTSGITRTSSSRGDGLNPDIGDRKLKDLNRWDPTRYVNIWVVDSIKSETIARFSCGQWVRKTEGGYAWFPGGDPDLDGIVISDFTANLMAHEMGHYLSLYHTFGNLDCKNDNCETDGDHVCDTPPDASTEDAPSCSNPTNSCTTDTASNHSDGYFPVDVPDYIDNVMDYGNTPCHDGFTPGQTARMRAAIQTDRSTLLQNECDPPCAGTITAAFTRDNWSPVAGSTVNFTNQSSGAGTYAWLVDGATVASSANFSYSFPAAKTYMVTLRATTAGGCTASYTDFVIVTCGVLANFFSEKQTIASGDPLYMDSIAFTNTSKNAVSYQWLLKRNAETETVVSTATNLVWRFDKPGNYTLRLIATNGGCSDTTGLYPIPVADATADGAVYFSSAFCSNQTKAQLSVRICNASYAPLPAGMPVTFYDKDPRDGNAKKIGSTLLMPDTVRGYCCSVAYPVTIDDVQGIDQICAVFNDAGATPFQLPATPYKESNYLNNVAVVTGVAFRVTISPATATLPPRQQLSLVSAVQDGFQSGNSEKYSWSPTAGLSCTNCAAPVYTAKDDPGEVREKLVVTSSAGCVDSAFAVITIPTTDDYSITIDTAECAAGNALHVSFTICNAYPGGTIPKGLFVSFYDGSPSDAGGAVNRVFEVPQTVPGPCASFGLLADMTTTGKLYAVVNDSVSVTPVQLPDDPAFPEQSYDNNTASYAYRPDSATLAPADTTVFRKSPVTVTVKAPPADPATTDWFPGAGFTLSCEQCAATIVLPTGDALVKMQTLNRYGCEVPGRMQVHVLPPDYTLQLTGTECLSNQTTLVHFEVCVSEDYDSIPAGLPVAFYDEGDSDKVLRPLNPLFINPAAAAGPCHSFEATLQTPPSGFLRAVVNDAAGAITGKLPERDGSNNEAHAVVVPFRATIDPGDTTLPRGSVVLLTGSVTGGTLGSARWTPPEGLSCTACAVTQASLPFTRSYAFIAGNEHGCLDTAYISLKSFAGGVVDIPNAFTPNADGKNDIFYVMGNAHVALLKEFLIFNRYGQRVFGVSGVPANDPRYGWNGTLQGQDAPQGGYVYLVKIGFDDGTERIYSGTFVLVR